jgi:hypothetical protein
LSVGYSPSPGRCPRWPAGTRPHGNPSESRCPGPAGLDESALVANTTARGIPTQEPTGFAAFESVELLALVLGSICLGIAVLRARSLPWWIGVALIVSCLLGAVGLPGAWFLPPDGLFFAALLAIGIFAVRGRPEPTHAPVEQAALSAAA